MPLTVVVVAPPRPAVRCHQLRHLAALNIIAVGDRDCARSPRSCRVIANRTKVIDGNEKSRRPDSVPLCGCQQDVSATTTARTGTIGSNTYRGDATTATRTYQF